MADEPGQGGATPPGPDPASGATPGGQQPTSGATPQAGSTEGATPDTPLGEAGQAALDRERDARRDAERKAAEYRRRLNEAEDASKPELERVKAQAERARLEAEAHQTRIAELESELSRRDLDTLKAKVAAEFELPPSVASRLQGSDLRALRADAKDLVEQLKAGQPVGNFGGGQGGSAAGRGRVDMNQLIREAAGRG